MVFHDKIRNKKLHPVVTEVFIMDKKLNNSLVFNAKFTFL